MHCDDALKHQLAARLNAFPVHKARVGTARAAAVALVVTDAGHGPDLSGLPNAVEWQPNAALILTRRSAKLRNHAGQWALPGGRIDAGETALDTARRELTEEVGLRLEADALLGYLDDFETRSGFVMTPVVLWAGPRREFAANPDEVESIHRIPLHEFVRDDAPMLSSGPEPTRPVLRMPVGDGWIAAPTAALLYQFREVCLHDKHTRVAHFDQPAFAWR